MDGEAEILPSCAEGYSHIKAASRAGQKPDCAKHAVSLA